MVDEPNAIPMFVNEQRTFINQNDHTFLVLHKTASGGSAQNIATFFANDPAMASTHYIVGQDGEIVQAVLEKDGAGGNCCLETGHASFLPLGVNLNVKSVSIEHVDPASDNSTPLTDAQKTASFRLVAHICERHNIPKRRATGDGQGGIIGHNDIAPQSRARCPGNYPWNELFSYLQGGTNMVPTGWHDDGTTLVASNGVHVTHGFREHVLSHNWASDNLPLASEFNAQQVEGINPSLGGGTSQYFRWTVLEYTQARGVFEMWVGAELQYTRNKLAETYNAYQQALQQIQSLQSQVKANTGLDATKVADRLTALGLIFKQGEQEAAKPI
jgi:N-acetyl-anhydromuramyl-L-alanine amidase AmpD